MKYTDLIIKDMETMNGYYFGTYKAEPVRESKGLEISAVDIARHFKNYEIDAEELFEECKEEIEKRFDVTLETINSVSMYELVDFLEDKFDAEVKYGNNTYNYCCQTTFQYEIFEFKGKDYAIVEYHRYGDVRGNYTPFVIYELECDDEFLDELHGCNGLIASVPFEYNNRDWSVYTNLMQEYGQCELYNHDTGEGYEIWIDSDFGDEKAIIQECEKFIDEKGI